MALEKRKSVEKISKLTEVERVRIIQKISESHPVDEDLAKLLPWKPKKIELGKQPDSYYLLTNEKLQIERYKRELSRVRGSASFRLGNLLESSFRNPVKLLITAFDDTVSICQVGKRKTRPSREEQF